MTVALSLVPPAALGARREVLRARSRGTGGCRKSLGKPDRVEKDIFLRCVSFRRECSGLYEIGNTTRKEAVVLLFQVLENFYSQPVLRSSI